jgi:hypothetical protein
MVSLKETPNKILDGPNSGVTTGQLETEIENLGSNSRFASDFFVWPHTHHSSMGSGLLSSVIQAFTAKPQHAYQARVRLRVFTW